MCADRAYCVAWFKDPRNWFILRQEYELWTDRAAIREHYKTASGTFIKDRGDWPLPTTCSISAKKVDMHLRDRVWADTAFVKAYATVKGVDIVTLPNVSRGERFEDVVQIFRHDDDEISTPCAWLSDVLPMLRDARDGSATRRLIILNNIPGLHFELPQSRNPMNDATCSEGLDSKQVWMSGHAKIARAPSSFHDRHGSVRKTRSRSGAREKTQSARERVKYPHARTVAFGASK